MPEGPEVRSIAVTLEKGYTGKILTDVIINNHSKAKIQGSINLPIKIERIYTRGKKLIFLFENRSAMVFSLGMTGCLYYQRTNHSHITFRFRSSIGITLPELHFTDMRCFGRVVIMNNFTEQQLGIGPDLLEHALTVKITSQKWLELFRQKKYANKEICKVLLEQELVAGIGNYLKSEILYFSKILPNRLVSSLSDEELEEIRIFAHQIIKESFEHGGLTIENYISPDGKLGSYPKKIYNCSVDPCGHQVIKAVFADGRASYYCPIEQK